MATAPRKLERIALATWWEEIVFTEVALAADPAAADLAEGFTKLRARLPELETGQREVWFAEMQAEAGVRTLDARLDAWTRSARFPGNARKR